MLNLGELIFHVVFFVVIILCTLLLECYGFRKTLGRQTNTRVLNEHSSLKFLEDNL